MFRGRGKDKDEEIERRLDRLEIRTDIAHTRLGGHSRVIRQLEDRVKYLEELLEVKTTPKKEQEES